eukprot:g45200.t1
MAEALNGYFALVFMVLDTSNIPEFEESQAAEVSVEAITKEKMLQKLKGQKVDKSSRLDRLHPRVLKEIAEEIVEALVEIFQKSLESRRLPEDWKMANVMPLLKKGRRLKTGNYRSVSLTSIVGKSLESIIEDEIAEYLEVHSKIGLSQYGFIKRRSCLANLLPFFEGVTSISDKGEPVDVIYLDFQKAFHKYLIVDYLWKYFMFLQWLRPDSGQTSYCAQALCLTHLETYSRDCGTLPGKFMDYFCRAGFCYFSVMFGRAKIDKPSTRKSGKENLHPAMQCTICTCSEAV